MARKSGVSPASLEHGVDQRPVRRRGEAEREPVREPLHRGDGPGHERQVLAVRDEHPADDLGVDLLRLVRDADGVVEVLRPLAGAHAHHRALHPGVVASASLVHVGLAYRVPDFLGVDQHAVEVEDRGVDHSAWYSASR